MHSERIRLIEFLTLFAIGGTERQVLNLAQGLDAAQFDLHIACLKRCGALLDEIESTQFPIVEYKTNSLYNYGAFRNQIEFARYVKRKSVQIVHTYGFYCNVFAIPPARLAGVPVVVASIRDTGEHWTPMQRRVQKLFSRLADCIVVNADAVRKRLIDEGYNPKKIAVIHNGIQISRYAKKKNDGRLHHEFGFPPEAPVVTVLARLNRLKGIDYFLDAAAHVARRLSNVRFLIVGDGASRPELECYTRQLGLNGRVGFTGFRLDVPQVLSETAVSVLPTLSEGLSNTLLESMAGGVPVVATDVGGNPEVVKHGETGFLVPPRDSAALARAIEALLRNPDLAEQFGRAGARRVQQHFSVENMVGATARLYEDLLRRPACRGFGQWRKQAA